MGIAVSEDWVAETINAYFKEMRDLVKGLAALGELTPRIMDAMASYGERLSTAILTQVLENNGMPAQLMDARECIVTDDNFTRAAVLFDQTDPAIVEHLKPVIKAGKIPVFQGFIGRTGNGSTTTIGRGRIGLQRRDCRRRAGRRRHPDMDRRGRHHDHGSADGQRSAAYQIHLLR